MAGESAANPARDAVVLVSGGLDSAVVLAIARSQGYSCAVITFDYGQRHRFEIIAAKRVARRAGVQRHIILPVDLRTFGGSALTDDSIKVPKDGAGRFSVLAERPQETADSVPSTYVPARNTVFLSLALAFAESIGARDIFIGANAIDYSGYPDCRPEFIRAFERVANVGTKMGLEGARISIHAPLIEMTKAGIVRRGMELRVDFALTHSCYDPDAANGHACGRCDSCILRARGFAEAGVPDPTTYSERVTC